MNIIIEDTKENFNDLQHIFGEMDRLHIKYEVDCSEEKKG